MRSRSPDEAALRSPDPSNHSAPTEGRRHFPCLEGLRALAASMVVFHHAASLAGEGRVGRFATPLAVADSGVAVFFVLSGFLIYRPFVVAALDDRPPLRARSFLWRRALRILPAYWLVLTVFWIAGNYELGPWREAWKYYAFVQIYDRFTALGGIVPAWSLATELTFYLLIPVWAFALRRIARGRTTMALELAGVAVLIVAGAASRTLISIADPGWLAISFTWLPNNIDLFGLGMGVAVLSAANGRHPAASWVSAHAGRRPAAWWAGAIAAFLVLAYVVGSTGFDRSYRGWFWQQRIWTCGVLAVCLLIPAVFGDQDRGAVRKLLRWQPVAWVGVVSYGLYLWHVPLMSRLNTTSTTRLSDGAKVERWTGWVGSPAGDTNIGWFLLVGFGLGLVAAAASWYLLEQPLQRRFKKSF